MALDGKGRFILPAAGAPYCGSLGLFQDLDSSVDAELPPVVSYCFPQLHVSVDPAFPGVDDDFVLGVVSSLLQRLPRQFRIVLVRPGVLLIDAQGTRLGNVAITLLAALIEGLHQFLTVNGMGQGLAYL